MDDYFFYIYFLLLMPIFVGLVLYLVYYAYHLTHACCCGPTTLKEDEADEMRS